MSLKLANPTVVIVARQFNPSIIRDHWLIKNEIIGESDIGMGSVFTDVLASSTN